MPQAPVTYSSPKLAVAMVEVFGKNASEIKVVRRPSKDVPRFLAKVVAARQKTASSKLRFK
ncbi:MAG: hypothetical protein QOD99_3062 [Chthoniobacter sp.]|jgi:hypothetical protein|nr:hypothetical protein [Chthoniobacter sp.]